MAQLMKTPGVSVEEITSFGSSVAPVATAIPAFLGFTNNHSNLTSGSAGGTAKLPVRITSFKEYEDTFGKVSNANVSETITVTAADIVTSGALTSRTVTTSTPPSKINLLSYNLQLYFANGGGPCYIVSIGLPSDFDHTSNTRFVAGLNEIKLVDEPTLLVFPEAYNLDHDKHGNLIQLATAQAATLQDRFVIADVNSGKQAIGDVAGFRADVNSLNNKYGALYYPALDTTIPSYFEDDHITVTQTVDIDGAGAAPGPYTGRSLKEILQGFTTTGPSPVTFPPNTGLYSAVLGYVNSLTLTLPASAAIAGVYAQVDDQRGVWKAPANVPLILVTNPSVKITDAQQGDLNIDATAGVSINAIRAFTGKGTIIWGARTMDGNSAEWKYINVRRLFIFIEESIQKAMQSYVFEPNTAQTWLRLKGTIDNFLTGLWRQGALAGAKPDDAFFVKVGIGTTMTADDILNGILNIEIGLAAARPAEFISLKFSQLQQVS
ncbi:MAG TPA: phage tail sheath C-terminal domain-containing protein [Cytophagaceae bacterium]|jgi:phage tail sheath protein FI|nr:phage tail sheath C-terminal domain-containing protein [Cytophagaceae bacterium]